MARYLDSRILFVQLLTSLQVVPDDSSHFDRRDIELESFVMKNHIDMCKLNKIAPAETSAYDSFVSALRGYLRLLESRVAAETADITAGQ